MASLLATFLAIVLALLRVSPAVLAAGQERTRREREAHAEQRRREKDARVDEAMRRAQEDHESSDAPHL